MPQRRRASEIRDLDTIVDALRFIKTPREIALMREVTRITGLGVMEAMREAAPGRYEYELSAAAEWVFRKHNAQGPGYFPLSATGPNTVYSHYHRGLRKLQDGDIIRLDAPRGRLQVLVDAGEFAARTPAAADLAANEYGVGRELFRLFRASAHPAELGAGVL